MVLFFLAVLIKGQSGDLSYPWALVALIFIQALSLAPLSTLMNSIV